MKSKLNFKKLVLEGMGFGDLKGLVLPAISFDEYESKINDDSIVFGFYVSDEDAANDLNRFIQRSSVKFLDSDVSPAPDQHGYYLVFIEMLNDKTIENNFDILLHDISILVDSKKWHFHTRDNGDINYSEDNLKELCDKLRDEKIKEFFFNSDLKKLILEGNTISLNGIIGTIIDFGNNEYLNEKYLLSEKAFNIKLYETMMANKLIPILGGNNWNVDSFDDYFIIRNNTENSLIIKII